MADHDWELMAAPAADPTGDPTHDIISPATRLRPSAGGHWRRWRVQTWVKCVLAPEGLATLVSEKCIRCGDHVHRPGDLESVLDGDANRKNFETEFDKSTGRELLAHWHVDDGERGVHFGEFFSSCRQVITAVRKSFFEGHTHPPGPTGWYVSTPPAVIWDDKETTYQFGPSVLWDYDVRKPCDDREVSLHDVPGEQLVAMLRAHDIEIFMPEGSRGGGPSAVRAGGPFTAPAGDAIKDMHNK
jgi:hypothetical protein